MGTRLVIVGGSNAGISAALRARQVDESAEVVVVVVVVDHSSGLLLGASGAPELERRNRPGTHR